MSQAELIKANSLLRDEIDRRLHYCSYFAVVNLINGFISRKLLVHSEPSFDYFNECSKTKRWSDPDFGFFIQFNFITIETRTLLFVFIEKQEYCFELTADYNYLKINEIKKMLRIRN